MFDDYIYWCQSFPTWIGFPMYLGAGILIVLLLSAFIALVISVSIWLLLLPVLAWAFFAIKWTVNNR